MRRNVVFTAVTCVAYYGLLLLGAFATPLLARPVFGAVPLSFVLGAGFIAGVVLLSVLYAWLANAAEPRP